MKKTEFEKRWEKTGEFVSAGSRKLRWLRSGEWRLATADDHFSLEVSVIEENIIYTQSLGALEAPDIPAIILLRDKIVNELGIDSRYALIDTRGVTGASLSARKAYFRDYNIHSGKYFMTVLLTSKTSRLLFKLVQLVNPTVRNWLFLNSLEEALTTIMEHKTHGLPETDPEKLPDIPDDPKALKAMTQNLLRENQKEKLFRRNMMNQLFSVISRLTWDDRLDNEDLTMGFTGEDDYSDIHGALAQLLKDVKQVFREKEFLLENLNRQKKELENTRDILEKSEAKYRSLFSNIAEPIFIFDRDTLRFLDCNTSVCTRYGFSREELLQMTPFDLHPPEEMEKVKEWIHMSTIDNPQVYSHITRDGVRFVVEILTDEIEYDGKPAWISVARDITQRIRFEEEMKSAREEAEKANIAKSRFLANMSHEIRTPMNAVIGLVDLVLTSELHPQQREYLSMTRDSAISLLKIINDILDISRIEAGRLQPDIQPFNLIIPLEKVMETFAVAAHDKGVSLTYDAAPDVPICLIGDEGRLRQILINLVGNAIKFCAQGKIRISVSRSAGAPSAEVPGQVSLDFCVSDTGIGIPTAKQDDIFESFTQVDNTSTRLYGGVGLGLSISRQLVHVMGGEMKVESKENEGSRFYFTLPFTLDESPPALATPEQISPTSEKSPRADGSAAVHILLAEDNPVNEKLMKALLIKRGWKVTSARNGKKLLELLDGGDTFDLVLMDVQMPEMDGLQATAAIRSEPRFQRLPIIALTAHALMGDREKFLAAGMNDYLSKPVDYRQLYDIIGKYLPPGA